MTKRTKNVIFVHKIGIPTINYALRNPVMQKNKMRKWATCIVERVPATLYRTRTPLDASLISAEFLRPRYRVFRCSP